MSLFIGKSNNGDGVLHITAGQHTSEELKSGVLGDTVFHNDLYFFTPTMYDVTLYPQSYHNNGTPFYCNYMYVSPTAPAYKVYFNQLTSPGFSLIQETDIVLLLDSSYNLIPSYKYAWASEYGGWWESGVNYTYELKGSRTSTHYIPTVLTRSCSTNTYGCTYMLVLKTTQLIGSSGVSIKGTTGGTPSEFLAGTLNLANMKYVSKGIICGHPSCVVVDGFFEIIDTSLIPGSVSLHSNSTETVITKGGYNIIKHSLDTYNNYPALMMGATSEVFTSSGTIGTGGSSTLVTGVGVTGVYGLSVTMSVPSWMNWSETYTASGSLDSSHTVYLFTQSSNTYWRHIFVTIANGVLTLKMTANYNTTPHNFSSTVTIYH